MSMINYNHSLNSHGEASPMELLPILLNGMGVSSLLDVGAGTGTWFSAARKYGILDTRGIDGVLVSAADLKCDPKLIDSVDLVSPFQLNRHFDIVLCLEVAEHLPSESAQFLIESITSHTDLVFFSAAIPGQNGQHHVNCQWPVYWQNLFNRYGFECVDDLRPKIWNMDVDPWYKNNMIKAFKSKKAGSEPRILSLIHPEMLVHIHAPFVPRPNMAHRLMNKLRSFISLVDRNRIPHRCAG